MKFLFSCCLLSFIFLVSVTGAVDNAKPLKKRHHDHDEHHHHRGAFGSPCKTNKQCRKDLACYVRGAQAFKCARLNGANCNSNDDCANNLVCNNTQCSCNSGTYYDETLADCIAVQSWGENCTSSDQCIQGSICSTIAPDTNVCLSNQYGPCNDYNGCANTLACINGTCDCIAQFEAYDGVGSCNLTAVDANEFKQCNNNIDCASPLLGCDNLANGAQSNNCLRVQNTFCNSFTDCANGLNCINSICSCLAGFYYDPVAVDCVFQSLHTETCAGDKQCYGNTPSFINVVACDQRIQYPTPNDGTTGSSSNTCLVVAGLPCGSSADCANSIMCQSGICGCPPNFYYLPNYADCFPVNTFGEGCSDSTQCASGLACDNVPGGDETDTCLQIPSPQAICSSDFDCANNSMCNRHGHCSCDSDSHWDSNQNVCSPNLQH
jgi:hypothetical protein